MKLDAEDRATIEALVASGAFASAEAAISTLMQYGKSHPHVIALLDRINGAAISPDELRAAAFDADPSAVTPLEAGFAEIRAHLEAHAASRSGR